MTTTIQVEDNTLETLRNLKLAYKTRTYDELINKLLRKKTPKSMFGKLARGKKHSMKGILKGLRDERDRF